MKIILSRKGFDSQYGGIASPILPDGTLVSLPIPSSADSFTLESVHAPGIDVGALVADLSKGKHTATRAVHLDPDLNRDPENRLPGWRPALGQTGNAQSHLRGQVVGVGDVFLFYGWFREAERANGAWRFRRGAPNLHVLFGWLEIGDILPIVAAREQCLQRYPWIEDHPHVATPTHYTDPRNVLYIAAARSLYSSPSSVGGGTFSRFSEGLRLTKQGATRSVWSLPEWFRPTDDKEALSYHGNLSRWQLDGTTVTLKTVPKGQEFVLDSQHYSQAEPWLYNIIRKGAQS